MWMQNDPQNKQLNMCEIAKYIQKQPTQYQRPPFFCENQRSAPNFENGVSEKNQYLGGLKEFFPQMFAL